MGEQAPKSILRRLRAAGYEAWYVGGCVRDTLLGRPVHDWDITTSALPEEVTALFAKTIPTGIRHGTVTVLEDGAKAEVTTYRADGQYLDGRHPAAVTFVRSLPEDLARRDFTVNAMAMDEDGTLVDLYGGRADLAAKLLRCVGDPTRRFEEDALRMLRAVRFAAQLGFTIESETAAAIVRCAPLAERLSAERVSEELQKTLLSPRPELVGQLAAWGLLRPYGLLEARALAWIAALPAEPTVRFAALKQVYPEADLSALRLPRRIIQDAAAVSAVERPRDRLAWKRLIAALGKERGRLAGVLFGETDQVEEILASGECLSLKELAVTGADFPALSGAAVGAHLQALLEHVLEHPEDNRRETLLTLAKP